MAMSRRDVEFWSAAIKFGIFSLVSVVVTYGLFVVMGGFGQGDRTGYQAVFTSASSLTEGDDVRVAGIIVGRVTDVEIHENAQALVGFEVDKDVPVTQRSELSVRFLNLIGDRYLSLTDGEEAAPRQDPDAAIGSDRTTPALNLTELFNGFQPLFAALNPDDVNELSLNIVQVLQGESGTVQSLLANTSSLTNSLADRDVLIGQVIDNLNELMGTVDGRRQELNDLVVSLEGWFGDLAEDKDTIGDSLESVSDLSASVEDLLTQSRPLIEADVLELRRVLEILNEPENKDYLDEVLIKLPDMLSKQTRIGIYGSWYNYYLCQFRGGIVLPDLLMSQIPAEFQELMSDFTITSTAPRCQ